MRNTKIALAVLALVASTAAMADGATVYGTIDASVAKTSGSTAFNEGSWAGTVLGVTGSEDLDGGMKATYNVEMGLNAGTGQSANGGVQANNAGGLTGAANNGNAVFNRATNVGLAGEFGAVKLGLQVSPYILASTGGVVNANESFYVNMLAMGGNGNTAGGGATASGINTLGFFIPNAVSYTTPSIGGFNATVLGQMSAGTDDNNYKAAAVNYSIGDVAVHGGYQKRDGSTFSATGSNYQSYSATATYAMGSTTLGAGYIQNENFTSATASTKLNVTQVSVGHKVADNVIVSLQYARNNGTGSAQQSLTNLGLQYNLNSKGTTYLYGTAARATNGASPIYGMAGSAAGTGVTGYAVGLAKSF